MKNIIFCMFCVFTFSLQAQNSRKITISIQNAPLQEVLFRIGEEAELEIFFLPEWLPQTSFSANYSNTHVRQIMEELLDNTALNYYLLEDRIILTRNNVLYDDLPEQFFGMSAEDTAGIINEVNEKDHLPVFSDWEKSSSPSNVESVNIGKANPATGTNRFFLSGTVVSAVDGKPISNLALTVQGSDQGTATNENGFYSIQLPAGENYIKTQSFGYEETVKRVVIYNDGTLNFRLREDYEQLNEVLLESGLDENVSQAVSGAEEVDVEEIKNIPLVLGERDILKVSATLPGISTAGEGAAGFNVRGGRADQNLILLDNAVIYNPAHFFGIFSALNPFTTGTANIYKGHIPAQYGGRLSSVFDLRTKKASTSDFAGEGSIGPVTGNLTLEAPIIKEKAGLMVGVRSTYSDWILKSLDEESLKDNEASFYDVTAKYNHKIGENTDLDVSGYYSKDKFNITSDSLYSYNNRLFSVELGHRFNDRHRGGVILTNSNYQFDIDYTGEFSNDFRSGYQINETGAKIHMRYRLNKKNSLQYGLASKLYLIEPGSIKPTGSESAITALSIPQEKGIEAGIFVADEFQVNEKLLINAGFRFSMFAALGKGEERIYQGGAPKRESSVVEINHYGQNEVMKTYGGPEVRVSARYLLQEDLSVKASYNSVYQYIHTLSTNTTVSPTDTYKLSDGTIKPQKANQYSLGLFKNFLDNTYELSLDGYYKTSDNIVDYKVGASLFLNPTIETEVLQGKGRSYGVEFLVKKTKGKLNGWLGYSYSKSLIQLKGDFREETVNNGEYFPSNFDKPHDFSVVANYKLTRRFSFSGNFVYQTGRPITYPVGKYNYNNSEYVMYSNRNEFRIPDYYRLDLSLNIEGNHRIDKLAHSFWSISVYNVLGRNNPYSVFFVTKDNEVKAYQSSIFSIPVPTITYNFKF
ncbi:TonB-dependent receptor [Salinimicrobium marinum]|uniref:TonB-dependent receptor n=1 Tax=Salinimicrobium marinum TaxID=680283 RepID=UPI001E41C473|nr:TonB-dependent receptor [Salinimicrobium marinum]